MKQILTIFSLFISIVFYGQQAELVTQEKNLGVITCISYSQDGRYIASGSDRDYTIKVWDVQSAKMIGILYGHEALINDINFSPDGNRLISLGSDKKNYVWDLNKWDLADSIETKDELFAGDFSDDGTEFYAGGDKKKIYFWSTNDYKTPKLLGKMRQVVHMLEIDKGQLVAVDAVSYFGLFDINTKKMLTRKKPHAGTGVEGMAFENGVVVSGDRSGTVKVTTLPAFKKKMTINAKAGVVAVAYNDNKKIIATAGNDNTVKIWNAEDGNLIFEFVNSTMNKRGREVEEKVRSVHFNPEGGILATSGYLAKVWNKVVSNDNSIKLYDVERQRLYKTLKGNVVAADAYCFNQDKNLFYTVNDTILNIWDLDRGERLMQGVLQERRRENVLNNSSKKEQTGKKVTKGMNSLKTMATTGRAPNLNTTAEKLKKRTQEAGMNLSKKILKKQNSIYVSSHGKYLVTNFLNDEYRLYALNDDTVEYRHYLDPQINGGVNGYAISPDENYAVFIGGGVNPISIIDLESGKLYKQPKVGGWDSNISEVRAMSFSKDGNAMAVVSNSGLITLYSTSSWTVLGEANLKGGVRKNPFIAFAKSVDKLYIQTLIGIFAVDTQTYVPQKVSAKIKGRPYMLSHPSDYIVSLDKEHVYFYDTKNDRQAKTAFMNTRLINHMEVNKFGYIGVSFRNGELKVFDPATGKERFLMVSEGDNAIFKTADNYYKINKEGTELVTFRVGKDAYPFEQFDAKFNRPDIVLEAMNSSDKGLIALYKKAYEKRLSKLGVSDGDLSDEMVLPEVVIANRSQLPMVTSDREVTLHIKASDNHGELKNVNVWINDVPVMGANGIRIKTQQYDDHILLQLAAGVNKIQVSATNYTGQESLKETMEIDCDVQAERNLYIVSIGTSKYKDDRYNLNYAAKDAKDIAVLLENKDNGLYKNVYHKVLTDEEVKKDNFHALKTFLSEAKIDDLVLVFIAGHGVLDSELDYYYGTHDIDFNDPSKKGLRYEEIENVLDGIAALKKLLIMDTCHSGEVEKDEVAEAVNDEVVEGDVVFRSVGNGIKEVNEDGVSPSKMAKELFADLRRGTGTTVISSAGGAEFAMESDNWKNGLFTYCLLSGLRNRTADLDKDGKIMLSELQIYVTDKVSKLSHGKQVPNSRIQNITLDYQIW